ncbi:MAG: hypothetical protein ACKO24_04805 [Leptolyngbyaceae cyanobacterium]
MRFFWGVGIGVCAAVLLAYSAQAELIASPESITLAGERASSVARVLHLPEGWFFPGDRSSRVTTTLTLSDPKGIQKLTAAVSDLRRADGAAFIPASSIEVKPTAVSVPTDAPQSLTITVDFAQAPASGEFTGSLYLYHQDGRQVIPLVARLKAAPLLPWLVMGLGVLLGTGLSLYRADGRSRDEIVVQIGRLRNQMRADTELDQDFRASIESELVDVFAALEDKDWKTAETEIVDAKNLWKRWRKYREDWLAQLAYGQKLITENFGSLADQTQTTVYMQEVKNNIDNIYRKLKTGQYKEPQELNASLGEVRQQIDQFRTAEALVESLRARRKLLPKEKADIWLDEFDQLESRLHDLSPERKSYETWQATLEEIKQRLEADIAASAPDQTTESNLIIIGRSAKGMPNIQHIPSAPNISAFDQPDQIAQAQNNLKWFNRVSRVVAIVFLAWLGMTELYANKSTFGSDPMRDYFALLAWGFGAELTRESVLRASQELGVTLTK